MCPDCGRHMDGNECACGFKYATKHEGAEHARAMLNAVKGRSHDHHGPNPCPVCGGVKS